MTAPPPETTEPGAAPPAAPPLVVSRRWDQLGGRLTALVNARSVAEALGLDVRFVWPRGADSSVRAGGQRLGLSAATCSSTQA